MDDRRFDNLARTMAAGSASRRASLRLLAAGALGALLPWLGARPVAAGCHGRPCANGSCAGCANTVCQKGTCCRPTGGRCTAHTHCCSGRCNKRQRKCRGCPSAEEPCGGACRPLCDQGARNLATCGCGGSTCPINCDDGIACTRDTCDASAGTCTHTPDDALCPTDFVCDIERGCVCPHTLCGASCIVVGGSCDTGHYGVCAQGTLQCVGNQPECVPIVRPGERTELCNGLDDDCDGQIDEDWPMLGQPCDGRDTDEYQEGVWVCGYDGSSIMCNDTTP